jgi:uncharacterized spore protein YtfJ
MDDMETLLKSTLEKMERMMSARTVVGDPITIEGKTLIPLISIGMGFGAGVGSGEKKEKGSGSGAGGGLGIKPVAVVILDKESVRVELLKHPQTSVVERIADVIPKIAESAPRSRGLHKEGSE